MNSASSAQTRARRRVDAHPGSGGPMMDLFLMIAAVALVAAIVSFVLYSHWQEFHGDNHF